MATRGLGAQMGGGGGGKIEGRHILIIAMYEHHVNYSWQSESKKDAYFWFCWHF